MLPQVTQQPNTSPCPELTNLVFAVLSYALNIQFSRLECVYLSNTIIIVLDKYTHSNLVYYKHNGDDEPYDYPV